MTRHANAYLPQTSLNPSSKLALSQRLWLVQGLSWIGSLSVLGGSMALAQTPSSPVVVSEPKAVPAAEVAPVLESPPVSLPAPSFPESLPPERSTPAPVVPIQAPISPPVAVQTPLADQDDGPSAIVFSERSTGCQATVRYGQGVLNGPCGAPKPVISPAASTLPSGIAAVQVGPLSISSSGIGVSSTPAARDYYNRSVRPSGRLGNGNIHLIFPLSIPAVISSTFGWRTHPITGAQRFHSGTDLAAPLGTPVLAAYAGKVAIADFLGGYGLAITLDHNKGTQQTLYGHLSELFVKPGEWVEQGTVIGRVGSTGFSTGPHLHFEFRQLTVDGWVAMDPGTQLEYAMAQLVKALQTAQAKPAVRG